MKRLLVLGGTFLALCPAAQAGEPWDGWVAKMKVPTPAYDLRIAPCPDTPADGLGADGCTWRGGPVYLDPADSTEARFVLYHELGHQFDYQMGTRRLRQYFRHVAGRHGPWEGPLRELFADAYATCAYPRRYEIQQWLAGDRIEPDGYGYEAKLKPHRRFCQMLRKLGRKASSADR